MSSSSGADVPQIQFREICFDDIRDAEWIAKWDADPRIRHLILPNKNLGDFEKPDSAETLYARYRERLRAGAEWQVRLFVRLMFLVDGQMAGSATLEADPPHKKTAEPGVAWLGIVIGEPWARGRGIGARVIRELESRALALGLTAAEAGVFEYNTPSLALFRKCGYREIARIPGFTYWKGKWWDDVRFAKKLSAVD